MNVQTPPENVFLVNEKKFISFTCLAIIHIMLLHRCLYAINTFMILIVVLAAFTK